MIRTLIIYFDDWFILSLVLECFVRTHDPLGPALLPLVEPLLYGLRGRERLDKFIRGADDSHHEAFLVLTTEGNQVEAASQLKLTRHKVVEEDQRVRCWQSDVEDRSVCREFNAVEDPSVCIGLIKNGLFSSHFSIFSVFVIQPFPLFLLILFIGCVFLFPRATLVVARRGKHFHEFQVSLRREHNMRVDVVGFTRNPRPKVDLGPDRAWRERELLSYIPHAVKLKLSELLPLGWAQIPV